MVPYGTADQPDDSERVVKVAYLAIPVPESFGEVPIAIKAWWSMSFTAKAMHVGLTAAVLAPLAPLIYRVF